MNLAIIPANGHLYLPSKCYLTPSIYPTELPSLSPTLPLTRRAMHTGWVWYELPYQQGAEYWQLSLGFEHDTLRTCNFGLPTTEPRGSWATWREENEKKAAVLYDRWLTEQLGATRTFAWGSAWAAYDPRSGASSIGLRYASA